MHSRKRLIRKICKLFAISIFFSVIACFGVKSVSSNERVARKFIDIVDDYYYDKNYNGIDWAHVKNRVIENSKKNISTEYLYSKILNPTLASLETSHAFAIPPLKYGALGASGNFEMAITDCLGFSYASTGSALMAKVLAFSENPAVGNLRLGDKIEKFSWTDKKTFTIDIISRKNEKFNIGPFYSANTSQSSIFFDENKKTIIVKNINQKSLKELRKLYFKLSSSNNFNAYDYLIKYPDIGLDTTLESLQHEMAISYVRNNSAAWHSGLRPGYEISAISAGRNGSNIKYQISTKKGEFHIEKFCDAAELRSSVRATSNSTFIQAANIRRLDRYSLNMLKELVIADSNILVLDLRGCSGGLISSLQDFAGILSGGNIEIGKAKFRTGNVKIFTNPAEYQFRNKLIVFVSSSTASSCEVLADFLETTKRATVFGSTTAGEAVVSKNFTLPDGGILQLPIADFLLKDGRRLEKIGFSPKYKRPSDPKLQNLF
jgi:hypothetical protein